MVHLMAMHTPTVSQHLLHALAYMQVHQNCLASGPTVSSADGAQASCTQLIRFQPSSRLPCTRSASLRRGHPRHCRSLPSYAAC